MKIEGTFDELTKLLDLISCPREINEDVECESECWNCISKYHKLTINRVCLEKNNEE